MFDREKPVDIEFETPLTTGAIRGTEFVLEMSDDPRTTRLALLDGIVDLESKDGSSTIHSGQEATVVAGKSPVVRPLDQPMERIQWALYYPAVLDPDELALSREERSRWSDALQAYRLGDLRRALAGISPEARTGSVGARAWWASLQTAVGSLDDATALLATLPSDNSQVRAVRELIASVQFRLLPVMPIPETASGWLARSYYLQSQSDLKAALEAARQSVQQSPSFGFAQARVAELELSFGRTKQARLALDFARLLCPLNPMVPTLGGFMELDRRHPGAALIAFDRAIALDARLGQAWMGRGIAYEQLFRREEAIEALQMAAALEPQRSVFRSALAKAYGNKGEDELAERELELAQGLDPEDPTPWFYSALLRHQMNEPNRAVEDLERSRDLNDNRSVFRSRLLLGRDRAARSANLAALYDDAGLPEVAYQAASQAVEEDYSGFAGHLFLANGYQQNEDPYRYELLLESARQTELLLANLLAPPGGGNLSQLMSQQDHLRFFGPRPIGVSSLTEYAGEGNWIQSATVFGTVRELSYAVDTQYRSLQGDWENQDLEQLYLSAQIKDQVSPADTAYFQMGVLGSESGDLAHYRSPDEVNTDLRVNEYQRPFLYGGWNHAWAPGSHTLVLVSYLNDQLEVEDPDFAIPFLRYSGEQQVSLTTEPLFSYTGDSRFNVYSAEAQQLWQNDRLTWVIGGRAQGGDLNTEAQLGHALTGTIADQSPSSDFSRLSAYVYNYWKIVDPLRLTLGASYDNLSYPVNTEQPPISSTQDRRDQFSPKVGLLWTPPGGTQVRAAYARSLGGLYFDNSISLEPTQVGGFNQTFRNLIPESVAGSVPGTSMDMAGLSANHAFPTHTYVGAAIQWWRSDGERQVGVMTNSLPLPIPDSLSETTQELDYQEGGLYLYASQLIGKQFSAGVRYRLTQAELQTDFPEIQPSVANRSNFIEDSTARLQTVLLSGRWTHPCGAFAEWRSQWFHQNSWDAVGATFSEAFWQHDLFIGYRFDRRRAEVRVGILNLGDTDYRLDPLNRYRPLARERTFAADLKLNF